jgi:hypothetical protein
VVLTNINTSGLSPEPAMPMAKLMPLVNKQVPRRLLLVVVLILRVCLSAADDDVDVGWPRHQVSQLLASDPNPFLDTVLHDDQLRQYAFDLFTAFGADE